MKQLQIRAESADKRTMRTNLRPRLLIAAGVTALAVTATGAGAYATRPASVSAPVAVELAAPAANLPADAPETSPTTAPGVIAPDNATRAEGAAQRAENAAGRAETAAVHIDNVIATTTTTTDSTVPAAPTASTPISRTDPVVEVLPGDTTTTTVPVVTTTTTTTLPPASTVTLTGVDWPAVEIGADKYNKFYSGDLFLHLDLEYVAGGPSTISPSQFRFKAADSSSSGLGQGTDTWTVSSDNQQQNVTVRMAIGGQTNYGTGWLWLTNGNRSLGRVNCTPTSGCQIVGAA